MIKSILKVPDFRLYQQSELITVFDGELLSLKQDMVDTLNSEKHGIGLAAPQIGVLKRAILIDNPFNGELIFMVNPNISHHLGEDDSWEGCLSVPNQRYSVTRYSYIVVDYQDEYGYTKSMSAGGLLSVCIQHEIDHLNGIVIGEECVR